LEQIPRGADAGVHFTAGNLLAEMERYTAAAREFELAQSGYQNPYDAGFNLMLAYVKSRQYPNALRTGEGLLARGYRQAEVYNLLAQAYEGDGKTAQAYEALRTATTLDAADPANYLDLIALCLTHRNYDLALEISDIAVARLPKSDRVRLQRGIVLAMKENFEGARAEFEAAVRLAPDAGIPYVALALMLLQMDRPADAIAVLRKRVDTAPDYLSLWFLGEALTRGGADAGSPEEAEAVGALTRSIASNPDVAQPRILLAKLLARRGNLAEAEKHLARALELDPENVSATYQFAQICQRKGDTARARLLFAKVSKAKAEDREQFTRGGLQHIIRAGSK
jgi:tetratricopeptide (TPR) repeat protein